MHGLKRLMLLLLLPVVLAAEPKPAYPPLPEAFSSFGAARSGSSVYVYGGHTGKTHTYSTADVTGKFRRLDLDAPAKGWEELPADLPLQGLALVAHKDKLYRIGGMQPRNKPDDEADNLSVASCKVFDPQTRQWTSLPDMPAGRSSHDAAVVGDMLVVVGGWQLKGKGSKPAWHDSALILDLANTPLRWQAIPQPFQRRALNATALDGKVYVVGGMPASGKAVTTVDILDPATRTWTQGPALPGTGRNGFTPAACTCEGRIFASPTDGKLYRLKEDRTAWEEVGSLSKPRTVHRIVPIRGGQVLVLGGGSRAGNIAELEAIEPVSPGKTR